jgi:hypothetical protein
MFAHQAVRRRLAKEMVRVHGRDLVGRTSQWGIGFPMTRTLVAPAPAISSAYTLPPPARGIREPDDLGRRESRHERFEGPRALRRTRISFDQGNLHVRLRWHVSGAIGHEFRKYYGPTMKWPSKPPRRMGRAPASEELDVLFATTTKHVRGPRFPRPFLASHGESLNIAGALGNHPPRPETAELRILQAFGQRGFGKTEPLTRSQTTNRTDSRASACRRTK